MKKIFFGMAALVAFVATSCQQTPDLAEVGVGGETATVSFNLGTPQIASRADFSDGTTASHLQWAVYDANGNILNDLTGEKTDFQISTTVEFQLTTGNTYYVLFWAAADGAPYTVDLAAKTMTVNYTGAVSSDEKRDAFYYYDDFTVQNGMDPISAELRRPFAQLNIGTNDFDASEKAGHKVTHAMVEVPAYSTLNFANGEVSDKAVRTFAYAAVPGASQEFPVNDAEYDYIAMNYLLMASTKETVDVKFTYATDATGAAAKSRTVGAVPVQRNHRTNLYGQLLTASAKVNVEIKPEYDDKHNGVIEVATAEQFNAAFADPDVDFIVLADDITLTTSVTRTNPTLTVSAGETLTIKLNNHRLTAESTLLFDVQGTLIIEDGTIENTTGQVFDSNDNLALSNVTILQSTDSAYYDEQGGKLELLAEGVAKVSETEIAVIDSCGMSWFDANLDAYNGFEGMTIKLYTDIDLLQLDANGEPVCFDPIGSYRFDKVFKGTFDGQDHIIKNMNQNTWALDNGYYYNDCGMGLFGAAQDATIKNIKMDKASISGESALCGIIVAVAENVTFENITVTNSKCADYQYYAGGIAGWVSGDNNKFINCNVDASTTIGGQWGDFANANGGVIGGTSGNAKIHMENCNVACQIDAHNDVVSSYQWYIYRRCGMLIGDTGARKAVDGRNYADAPQLTCKNVTVTYGEWANYTYCQFTAMGYPWVRVQAGISCEAYSNIRYGHPTDANGNTVVDDNHVHNEGEGHHVLIEFDQLLGGGANGNGRDPVYGTKTFEGVTVIYNNK